MLQTWNTFLLLREKLIGIDLKDRDNLSHSITSSRQSLLAGTPVFSVRNRQGLVDALSGAYSARVDSLAPAGEPVFAVANRAQLDMVALHYCRYDAPVRIGFTHMAGFRQFFCLNGAGRVRTGGRQIEIAPTLTGILPPDSNFDAEYGGGYEHLVVQVDQVRLQRLQEAWDEDATPAGQLPVLQTLEAEKLHRLRRIALCLADQFDDRGPRSNLVAAELEQALAGAFLHENSVRFLAEPTRPPALAAADDAGRLRDYVEAHWDRPLLVEDIAAACGISVRSVFDRFKRDFEATPAAYLRLVRLQHAHRMLSGGADGSVIDVALRCGFSSLGHFARRYREAFGELPSETLERARLR